MEFQQILNQFVGDGHALILRIALAWPPSSRRTRVTREVRSGQEQLQHPSFRRCTHPVEGAGSPSSPSPAIARACLCIIIRALCLN